MTLLQHPTLTAWELWTHLIWVKIHGAALRHHLCSSNALCNILCSLLLIINCFNCATLPNKLTFALKFYMDSKSKPGVIYITQHDKIALQILQTSQGLHYAARWGCLAKIAILCLSPMFATFWTPCKVLSLILVLIKMGVNDIFLCWDRDWDTRPPRRWSWWVLRSLLSMV